MKIIEKEFNVQTGEETIIERDATSAEIAEIEKVQLVAAIKAAELVEKQAARLAILEKLGISEDEAKLLLS